VWLASASYGSLVRRSRNRPTQKARETHHNHRCFIAFVKVSPRDSKYAMWNKWTVSAMRQSSVHELWFHSRHVESASSTTPLNSELIRIYSRGYRLYKTNPGCCQKHGNHNGYIFCFGSAIGHSPVWRLSSELTKINSKDTDCTKRIHGVVKNVVITMVISSVLAVLLVNPRFGD